jgi:toxin secretion/phage lysis holin
MKKGVLVSIAAVGSFIARQLGGWDAALTVLACMMVIDILTGLAVAAIFKKSPKTEGGKISSAASFKGITKKVVVLVLVGLAVQLDRMMKVDYVRNLVIIFYIGSEGLSILENLVLMDIPFPGFIKKLLEIMKDKGDKGEAE